MNFKYPLSVSSWDHEEINAINKVTASGMFTMGENVKIFEDKFAEYIGSKYAVMVNSGSSANLLAIGSLFYTSDKKIKLKKGDEVIVPAVSWSTTYFPLYQYGLKIKFVDIDKDTLNIDLEKLENSISEKTRAIFAVNILGNPNDFSKINELIKDRDIILLEDNCESLGAEYKGKKTGTFGLVGTFSSFFSHHICTMEGGVIVTDNEEIYNILLCMRAHGWTRNLPEENILGYKKNKNSFYESFNFILPGYNLRPLEFSGATGIEQIKKIPNMLAQRKVNSKQFNENLKDIDFIQTQKEIGVSSWFGFSLLIKDSRIKRDALIQDLNKIGFECRPIVSGNFTKQKAIQYIDYEIHGSLDNADFIHDNGIFIGNHHIDIRDGLDELKKTLILLN